MKFRYVGDYNKSVNSGLEGQQFRNKIGVGVLIEPPNDKMLPSFKRGAISLLKSRLPEYRNILVFSKFGHVLTDFFLYL